MSLACMNVGCLRLSLLRIAITLACALQVQEVITAAGYGFPAFWRSIVVLQVNALPHQHIVGHLERLCNRLVAQTASSAKVATDGDHDDYNDEDDDGADDADDDDDD